MSLNSIPWGSGGPTCPYCGEVSQLRSSIAVYQNKDFGPMYICRNWPECDAYVGVHKGTTKPLGRLADFELREAKKEAHKAFDPLWRAKLAQLNREEKHKPKKRKGIARGLAYKWLAEQMGVDRKKCHIGEFDVAQCHQVVEICAPFWLRRKSARRSDPMSSEAANL